MATDRAAFPSASRLLRFTARAFDSSESPLQHLRSFVKIAEQQVGGPWWKKCHDLGTRRADQRKPISPLGEMVRTYFPHVLGDVLLPVVEPTGLGSRGDAYLLQSRLRQWFDDAGYANEDEKSVLSSLLACSAQHVSRREGGTAVATEAGTLDLGQPSVQAIPLHQMVIDPSVEDDWESGTAIGHWYAVDRQSLIAAGIGNEELLNEIPNVWQKQKETMGLGKFFSGEEDQYLDDKILLWELCFRHQGRRFCCTLPPVEGIEDFIVEPYELVNEPEGSRYVITMLDRLPFSSFPVSPAMTLMDAHLAKAAVAAKLTQQIEELERKYVGEQGTQDTIMRLLKKGGEQFIIAKNSNIKEFIRGGMVKELMDGFQFLEALGKQIGPNVDIAGGRDDPSNSATMGAALVGNAAVAMGYWKQQINKGREKVLRRVAALLLQGQDQRELVVQTPAGPVPIVWDAATLDISYDQFKYRIKPTSAAAGMDARAKLRSLAEIMQTLPGMVQIVLGWGGDPQKAVRVISDLAGMPELDELLPTGDWGAIQQQLFAMLAQNGQAMPTGMGPMGQMGGMANGARMQMGMPQMGAGAAQPKRLASPGPMTGVGNLNSNLMSGRVPA